MLKEHINFLYSKELQSIKENKEHLFFYCNNTIHPLQNIWNNETLLAAIPTDKLKECGNEKPILLHTHILHDSSPSYEDFNGYNKKFFDGICVIGIDGIQCYNTKNERTYVHDWFSKFKTDYLNNKGNVWTGKNVFCDHLGSEYYCEIQNESNDVKKMGIFKNFSTFNGKTIFNTNNAHVTFQSADTISCLSSPNNESLSCIAEKKNGDREI